MSTLPTGTVTVLFTDIQGSTKLWQAYPDSMPAALARHHTLVRGAIESQQGYVFQIVGDAFCAAFATAADGVRAALAAQRALRAETWGETGPIAVRMALETGPVEIHAGEYVSGEYASGLTLSRAARLLAAGHGGQVLLSAGTAELVRDHLPPHVTLRDLGTHQLKDLEHPLTIFQLVALDLPFSFPLLRTIRPPVRSLPTPLTRFIGRSRERAEIKQLLLTARLVTLTGPGGTGKTRLSIEAAREMADEFQDGVAWIPLAEIQDPALVDAAIAHALDLPESAGKPRELLKEYLRDLKLLLVLDNFEQVTSAASLLADLLAASAGLHLLVTSREALHIQGEQQYLVPPLGLPDGAELPLEELLQQNEAVQLFIERARAIKPSFSLTLENRPAVVEIVARLDRLPLAIELAAARIKVLTPAALLKQLKESGLGLLTSTARDLPARQQTLRNAIAWSYNLLPADEQDLFRRFGVFVGGATMEAIEAVCSGNDSTKVRLLDMVGALADKSLLAEREEGDAQRFAMLETIGAYAQEKLRECGQEEMLRDRHLAYYLAQAEEAERAMRGPAQREWFDRLEREMGNIREALEWCKLDPARANFGLSLAAAIGTFWIKRGHVSEGWTWLNEMVQLDSTPSPAHASTLAALSLMAYARGDTGQALSLAVQGQSLCRELNDIGGLGRFLAGEGALRIFRSEYDPARTLIAEGVSLLRKAGDKAQLADALSYYGIFGVLGRPLPEDIARAEEAAALFNELGDQVGLAETLHRLGAIAQHQKDLPRARRLTQQALENARDAGAFGTEMECRGHLAEITLQLGDYDTAASEAQQVLDFYRPLHMPPPIPWALDMLGHVALQRGDAVDAAAYFRESMDLYRQIGGAREIAESLAGFAGVALLQKDIPRAIRLLAASSAFVERVQGRLGPADAAAYERHLALARSKTSPEAFQQAWAEGSAMDLEPAISYALQLT